MKRDLCCLFSTCFSLLVCLHIEEQNELKDKAPESACGLKILCWYLYMLPPIALSSSKLERAAAIAELLSQADYDILVYQEAFHPQAPQIIVKKKYKLVK